MGIHETRQKRRLLLWQSLPWGHLHTLFRLSSLRAAVVTNLWYRQSFERPNVPPASTNHRWAWR